MLRLRDVARELGLPIHVVTHAANSGKLKTYQRLVGGMRLVRREDLDAFKRAHVDPVRETADVEG